jgi:hypothetical protein
MFWALMDHTGRTRQALEFPPSFGNPMLQSKLPGVERDRKSRKKKILSPASIPKHLEPEIRTIQPPLWAENMVAALFHIFA